MSTSHSHVCIVLLAAGLALAAARAEAQSGAHLLRVVGSVEIAIGEPPSWRPAQPGQELPPGAALRTGDHGRAEVALESGTVRVYENSLLRITARRDPGTQSLWMGLGASIFDVKLEGGDRFEVETPEAVAAVKGTRFHVRVEAGRASVGVYDGVVELRGAGLAERLLVREGFGARSGGEMLELVVLKSEDPWRAWETGAPAPDLSPGSFPAAPDLGAEEPSDAASGRAEEAARNGALEDAREHEDVGESPADAEVAGEDDSDAGGDPFDGEGDLFEREDDPFVRDDPFEDHGLEDAVEPDNDQDWRDPNATSDPG